MSIELRIVADSGDELLDQVRSVLKLGDPSLLPKPEPERPGFVALKEKETEATGSETQETAQSSPPSKVVEAALAPSAASAPHSLAEVEAAHSGAVPPAPKPRGRPRKSVSEKPVQAPGDTADTPPAVQASTAPLTVAPPAQVQFTEKDVRDKFTKELAPLERQGEEPGWGFREGLALLIKVTGQQKLGGIKPEHYAALMAGAEEIIAKAKS